VRDAALAYTVLAGHDPLDATSSRSAVGVVLPELERDVEGLRVGVIREVDLSLLAPDARGVWDRALERLQRRGAEVVEVSIPDLPASIAIYYVLANCEASANLARFDGVRYGERVPTRELQEMYVESRSQGFGAEVKRRIMLGTFALSSGYADEYYGRAHRVLAALRAQMAEALRDADVLLTPTSPTAAFRLGERSEDPLAMYLSDIFTVPANLVGAPALAVPVALDDAGLPLSLQVMGRPFDDALVLRVGAAVEADQVLATEPPWS
jgi:aspartyl-tRNA(Asn)/glutamyl-tRNA(Gln) amidotransferase subunit A